MSLINEMLKDLEVGRQRQDRAPAILQRLRSTKTRVSKKLHPAFLLIVAVIIVAIAAWFIPARQKHAMPEKQQQAMVQAIHSSAQQTLQATKPKPPTQTQVPTRKPEAPLTLPQAKQEQQVNRQLTLLQEQQEVASVGSVREPAAMTETAGVKTVVPMERKEKLAQLYSDAQQAMDDSDDDKAIDLLKELLVRDPKNLSARQLLGAILLSDNRIKEAKQVVNVGLRRVPDFAPFDNLEARILMGEGKLQAAIDQLSQASPDIKKAPEYYALLAVLYQQTEQYMMSAQLYHQLVQENPSNAVWWMGLGIALESAEKNNAALEAFNRAVQAYGLSPSAKAYVQQQIQKLS